MLALKLCRRPERVADLVHHDFLDRLPEELVGELELLVLLFLILSFSFPFSFSFFPLLFLGRRTASSCIASASVAKRISCGLGGGVIARRRAGPGSCAGTSGPGSGPSRTGTTSMAMRCGAAARRGGRLPSIAAFNAAARRRARRRHGSPNPCFIAMIGLMTSPMASGIVPVERIGTGAGGGGHAHQERVFFLARS